MKKTIWKYELEIEDSTTLVMPIGAEILTVQHQFGIPVIWALVDPNASQETRHFETFGTGHEVYCDMGIERKYLGTYQLSGGQLVFHVFERIN